MSYTNHSAGMTSEPCARLDARAGIRPVLEGVNVQADVRGLLFELDIEQHYVNPNPNAVEIAYTFPMPWGAELLEAEAWIGERHLVGKVQEKQKAAKRYDDAIAHGDTALLLEDTGNGLWSMSLGNLGAGERCRLRIRYAQVLSFSSGSLRLTVPTVVAPRYGVPDSRLMPWQSIKTGLDAEYPFSIKVRIHGALAGAVIASPSHSVQTRWQAGVAELELNRKAWLDRDFILQLGNLPQQSLAIAAQGDGENVVLAGFCPALESSGHHRMGVKMLVDCSGSMGGDSIEAARRALTAFIAGLTDEDRFSLSRFGSTIEHRSNGLWTLNAQTRIAAQRWVDGLQADLGGTQMEEALVSTFALTGEDITDVLLVTDGEIHAVDSTVKAARESGHRVFVVGIGSSPAEPLLRKLAEATGGACEFVAPGEAVEEAIRRMITRLGGRKVSGLRLAWPEGISPLWQSTCPKALFTGDTLPVFARVPEGVTGSLLLMGMLSGEKTEVCLGETVLGSLPDGDAALVRMAAALEIRELIAVGQREKALGLSLRHQLVNELTSSLMVLKRAADEKQGDMPDQVIVEQMLPAGWGGAGSVMEDVFASSASTTPGVADIELFFDIGFNMRSLSAGIMSPSVPLRQRQCGVMASNPSESLYSGNGLSPLKLVRVLRQGSPSTWPDSFAGLRQLGLGDPVIDWLELVAGPALGLTESGVVKVFLSLFTAREMEDVLAGKRQPSGLETDPAKAALWSALIGISAEKWPDCILNLNWGS